MKNEGLNNGEDEFKIVNSMKSDDQVIEKEDISNDSPDENIQEEEQKSLDDEVGEALIEKGCISIDQLEMAKKEKNRMGVSELGEVLVLLGFVTESVSW